ncbi:cytospin-A isoform X4 [Aedes albopictus]|uniref:Calponin-homology (CH) domain-containing protein n=2 Tax=Aedes albopictus TaxID=7160 RepID=A0ABM1Z6W1_AEDAL
MHSITQKLRNVFSWQHDTYEFESYQAVTAMSSENMQTNQDQSSTAVPKKGKLFKPKSTQPKVPRGAVSKISKDKQKLNQILVTRNPSVSSAQLNAAVPLVNIRRVPSNKSVLSELQTDSSKASTLASSNRVTSLYSNVTVRNKTKNPTRSAVSAAITSRSESSSPARPNSHQRGLFSINRALPKVPATSGSRPPSGGSTKQPLTNTTKSSADAVSPRIQRQAITRKAPPVPGVVSTTDSKSPRKVREKPPPDDEPVYATISRRTPTSIRRQPVLSTFGKARGQGPSGSKHSSQSTNNIASTNGGSIKGASSVSSLDCVGIAAVPPKSTAKHNRALHGSKDKLDQYGSNSQPFQAKGSREKLADLKHFGKEPKAAGIRGISTKTGNQMPIVQPQPPVHQHHQLEQFQGAGQLPRAGSRSELDQRDDDAYSSATEEIVISKDLTAISFGGPMEDLKGNRMQELHSHLERLRQENADLEEKVVAMSVYQKEVQALRDEIVKLQTSQEMSNSELHRLLDENETLRDRLKTVVQSPLSDSEKQQIIRDSQRLHSSAPASIALPNNMDMEGTPCVTPDWDKQSSSSEIAVACLQDKITQMEETHYSTNEELQATLQELADLQSQINELQTDNERLAEEKDVIFQSLCRQTEKLEDSRTQIGTLQKLLLREPNQQDGGSTEREQKLVELLKNAQEERESLMLKQEELNSELNELKVALEDTTNEKLRLHERIGVLESTIDATNAERTEIDAQLLQSKEDSSVKQIEISRLTTLLENARAKIEELEQDRALGDKSDLGELLDTARKEKDALEIQVASLQEQVSISQCEIQKLKDQLARMSEECKVVRNNAKCVISDLEYKHENIKQEKVKIASDCQQLQENVSELQVQNKCLNEDKAQLEALLSETQRHLGDTERLLAEKTDELNQEINLRRQESEEWDRFQSDLLMTVRVANDFKTEAHNAREQLALDNKALRERIRIMEQQVEKLNKLVASTESHQSIFNTVQQEMAVRRQQKSAIQRQDSRLSVKSLIESIENSAKQAKVSAESRCSSSSSINSIPADTVVNPTMATSNAVTKNANNHNGNESSAVLHSPLISSMTAKSPLREQQQPTTVSNISSNPKNNPTDTVLLIKTQNLIANSSGNLDSSNNNNSNYSNNNISCNNNNKVSTLISNSYNHSGKLFKQQADDHVTASILSHKTMDYVRRNSYGDISDRKDPLNALVKNGGSKRNALLKWCQNKTVGYRNIDITNFSSSWNDGLALCAIMHSYLPDRIPYDKLSPNDKRRNFSLAFAAAESVGIPTSLSIDDMCQLERPDWQQVMGYVTAIYKHFET